MKKSTRKSWNGTMDLMKLTVPILIETALVMMLGFVDGLFYCQWFISLYVIRFRFGNPPTGNSLFLLIPPVQYKKA